MFASCAGKCYKCYLAEGGCLAGHGDDDFTPATEQQMIERLVKSRFSQDHDKIRAELEKRNPQRYGEPTNSCGRTAEEVTREMLELAKKPLVLGAGD